MLQYPDGKRYEGEWSNNKRNGEGTCVYSDGEKYEGQWLNDSINGKGILICLMFRDLLLCQWR